EDLATLKWFITRGKNYTSDLDLEFSLMLVEVYSVIFTGGNTDLAFLSEGKKALCGVYDRDGWHCL
ncbi:unnamed protein product, partial [marine sediment metagenome]